MPVLRRVFVPILGLVILALVVPVTGVPGTGPTPVPTRVQSLALSEIALPHGGTGRTTGVGNPVAAASGVVETDEFGLVGLTWDEAPPAGSLVKVRVREADGWTSWMPLNHHSEHGPDPDAAEGQAALQGTDPLLTGKADALQVSIQTPDGVAPDNTAITLVDTDDVGLQQQDLASAAAAPRQPTIITRAQWGADESKRNRDPIYSSQVKVGFVHHTVSSSTYTPDQAAAQVRNLYAWYTQGLKYSDIAYNFLVDRFGRLYEGRAGGMDRPVVGGHTAGLNNDSFAVSAMGNFEEFNPKASDMSAIKESIAALMAWKLGLTKRDPAGTDTLLSNGSLNSGYWEAGQTANLQRVSGHRDAGNTACPGKYLYAQVPAIRTRASQIFKGGSSTKPKPKPRPPDLPDLLTPDPTTSEFEFRGAGSGDGVGVPRAGVIGQARDGRKAGRIVRYYLTGSAVQALPDKVMRIQLTTNRAALPVDSSAAGRDGGRFQIGQGKKAFLGTAATRVRMVADGADVLAQQRVVKGKKVTWRTVGRGSGLTVRWAGTATPGRTGSAPTVVRFGKDTLRKGRVTVANVQGRLRVVAALSLNTEYLPYLTPQAVGWPDQARRAMAIIARSQALSKVYSPECACHGTDAGFSGAKATSVRGSTDWRKAVAATSQETTGLAATYQDAPIPVPVFDSSGGATLNAEDVVGQPWPWARSVADPWSLKPANNPQFAEWPVQIRSNAQVASAFGLPDVVRLDLRKRLTGGAVDQAVATSSSGSTATIAGSRLRTALQLPSAFVSREVETSPGDAAALSVALTGTRKGSPIVVNAGDAGVLALAARHAAATQRPLVALSRGMLDARALKVLRSRKNVIAVGALPAATVQTLGKAGRKLTRVTAGNLVDLSLKLARSDGLPTTRTIVVTPAGDINSLLAGAATASRNGYRLLVVDKTPTAAATTWLRAQKPGQTIVLARKSQISNADAVIYDKAVRAGMKNPVAGFARMATVGGRRPPVLVTPVNAYSLTAVAVASARTVVVVDPATPDRRVAAFLQRNPRLSVLRAIGGVGDAVSALRLA